MNMKIENTALLITIRFMTAVVGFGAAVSLVRAFNRTFDLNVGRLISNWLNFGLGLSLLLLVVCLAAFVLSIWLVSGMSYTKHLTKEAHYPLRRVDYLFLLVSCFVGFVACAGLAWQQMRWGGLMFLHVIVPLTVGTTWTDLLILPLIAYALALLALGELVARLRDRTLVKTLYWISFFRAYSVWRPVGFFSFLLLATQLLLMVFFIGYPAALLFSLASIGAFTYCVAHMLDLAKEYDKTSADKIRAERFKSELITNVSHDIRTPLTSIINYVDLLMAQGMQGQAAEYVKVLVRKSTRLKTLIDDLMEASKAGTGNMRVEAQRLNLAEIIGQVAGEFEDRFDENGLTLVIRNHAKESPVLIFADSRHLYRALENLFSNAAKYAQPETRVFAEIFPLPREGKVQFALQNTSSIPIEFLDEDLTAQFIRGDKARNTEGSGLGLYIAKSLVELMGGSLDINVIGDLFRVEIELNEMLYDE